MPKNVFIDINDGPTSAEFSPKTQTVAVGDLIYWRNNTKNMHELVLKSKPDQAWGPQIPGKLDGQPAPTSQKAMVFGAATAATGVDYISKLYPQVTGTIIAK
jgi:plastocyanin